MLPFRLLYTLWAGGTYFIFMLIAFPLFFTLHLLMDEIKAHRILMLGYAKWWAAVWGFLCGFKMQVVKNPKVKKDESYVFVSTHNSNLDAMLWVYATDNLSKGLAKTELLKVPILGYLFKKTCVIVDRSSKESRRKSMEAMKAEMGKGVSIMIFPEGTRNKTGMPLQPFHDGAFRIAIDLQKPIVPVVMLNTGALMPSGSILFKPGTARCIFLDPIPTAGLTEADLEELKRKTFALMEKTVVENDARFSGKNIEP
ncbi:MAG TPA: lysophospholipid acyltransferase family protein [Chitinophagales bacterium]|nr:lysophospholipid acyltransferase family protein [Chitinophagales bacterium]